MALSREPALDVPALKGRARAGRRRRLARREGDEGRAGAAGHACDWANGHHSGSQAIDGRREAEVGAR